MRDKPISEVLDDAQKALAELCRDPRSFVMHVPVDEERDIDCRIGAGLRAARRLQAEVERLREALERYGQHEVYCARHGSDVLDDDECECGLDRALAARALTQEEPTK